VLEIGRVNRRTAIFDCRLQPRGNPIAFLGQFFERHSWWSHSHAPILTLTGFCLQSQWPLRRMGAMALKSCRECGGQVSRLAARCPHCGTKRPSWSSLRLLANQLGCLIFVLLAAAVLFGGCLFVL
jgi:hypothetical protein